MHVARSYRLDVAARGRARCLHTSPQDWLAPAVPTLLQVDLCNSMAPVPTRTAQEMEELQLLARKRREGVVGMSCMETGWLLMVADTVQKDQSMCSFQQLLQHGTAESKHKPFLLNLNVLLNMNRTHSWHGSCFPFICGPRRPAVLLVVADTVYATRPTSLCSLMVHGCCC